MEETADADGRSPIIQKTTVVETTTRTVLMDERGNVIDESETREVRGDDAETTPAEKLLLTDAQLELVARTLREKHGVEVEPREIAELLDRLRTKIRGRPQRPRRRGRRRGSSRARGGRRHDERRHARRAVGLGLGRLRARRGYPHAHRQTRRGRVRERGGERGGGGGDTREPTRRPPPRRPPPRPRPRNHRRVRSSLRTWCTTVDSNLVAEAESARSAPAPSACTNASPRHEG